MPTLPVVQKQYRSLAVKVALTLALAAAQVGVWSHAQARAVQLSQKRSQDRQIADLRSRLDAAQQKQSEQRELRDQLDVVVPRQNSLPQVIDRLERLAVQQQVVLAITDIREKTAEETAKQLVPAQQLVVTLQARGSATELLRYLEVIEHAPELTVVEQWSLVPGDAAASPLTPYLLTVQVLFFLQTDDDGNE